MITRNNCSIPNFKDGQRSFPMENLIINNKFMHKIKQLMNLYKFKKRKKNKNQWNR